jgi:hypothetical protein
MTNEQRAQAASVYPPANDEGPTVAAAQQADPDELALIVFTLYGATLRGFCRVIEKALGVRRA